MSSYSIVLPNYNGTGLLKKFFPSVYAYAKSNGMEVIVVDDASTDDSVAYLAQNYPDVKVLVNQSNLGFGGTVNRGVEEARGENVFLFNTDILVESLPLGIIEEYVNEPDFFGLTFQSLNPDGKTFREGAKNLKFKMGLPVALHNPSDQKKDEKGRWLSIYPVGGHAIVNRRKFLELKGFCEAYSPYYWEDMDLGFRATQKGWKIWYDERLKVIHDHQGAIKTSQSAKKIKFVKERNRFVFMYRNIPKEQLSFRFYLPIMLRSLENLIKLNFVFFSAWSEGKKRALKFS